MSNHSPASAVPRDSTTKRDGIVVAIDFGTTYSGVAWIRTDYTTGRNQDAIPVIQKWPSRIAPQVRSEIEYDANGKQLRWGYLENPLKKDGFRFTWIKSLLAIQSPKEQREALEMNLGSAFPKRLSVRGVVRDYIQSIFDHVIASLIDEDALPADAAKNIKKLTSTMEFVMTFPACWSGQTQQEYKDALRDSSLGAFMRENKVHYLKEPEAAMIGTLHSPQRKGVSSLGDLSGGKDYTKVAILDAGGGTLDFSAYTVEGWDPLNVTEIRTDGEQLGGSDVDKAFWALLGEKLAHAGCDADQLSTRCKIAILSQFERVKQSFPHDPNYILPLPMDAKIPHDSEVASIEEGHLVLTKSEMKRCFDTVVNKMIEFLDRQKKKLGHKMDWHDTVLFLVGGFGNSDYARDQIRKWAEKSRVRKFLAPQESWTAVVSGAAKYGLCKALKQQGPVRLRISPYHIGVVTDIPWRRGVHAKDQLAKNPGNKKVVKEQIIWLIHKDKPFQDKKIMLEKTFDRWPKIWNEKVVLSEKDTPSTDLSGSDVKPLGEIKVDSKQVPFRDRQKNHYMLFRRFFKINYELELSFPGADVRGRMVYKRTCYGKESFRFARTMQQEEYQEYYQDGFLLSDT